MSASAPASAGCSAWIPHAFRIQLEAQQWQALGLFPEARIGAWLKQLLGRHEGETAALWWPVWPRTPHTRVPTGGQLQFALYAVPAALPTLKDLLRALRGLPGTAARLPEAPFGRGLRCSSITPLDPQGGADGSLIRVLQTQARLLQQLPHWRCCWRSPARLRRSGAKAGSGEARFIHHERDLDGTRLRQLLGETLQALGKDAGHGALAPALPALEVVASELFWLDLEYRDTEGRSKPCGGLLGEMLLRRPDELSAEQAMALSLSTLLGCGQRRAFGMGQFVLEGMDGSRLRPEPEPQPSLLLQLGVGELLQQTRWRQLGALEDPHHNVADTEAHSGLDGQLQRMADRWASGALITPAALTPVQIPKADGSHRQLLIPRLSDRIAQRVLLDQLSPPVDILFSRRSYGFRPGRSRQQARDRLLALHDQGLRVIAESDVAEFFDQVDFWRIGVRLRALFGHDPVVQQILAFISAPVRTDDQPQPRSRGLPQGAPLSPWLSNLMLDDLDQDLSLAGFEAVRYADDFVIAARDTQQAEAGLQLAALSLGEKGLLLKSSKSRITTFDAGFTFLGYQFVGGLAVDIKGKPAPFIADPQLLEDLADHRAEPATAFEGLPDLPPADHSGSLLIVSRPHTTLAISDGQLLARWPDGDSARWPLRTLAAVVLIGRQRLTSQALQGLLGADVPLHIADGRGRWLGATTPWPRPLQIELWSRQRKRFAEAAFALELARATVAVRILHQQETLRRRLGGNNSACAELESLARRAEHASDLASLRGYEGSAARTYFQALQPLIPADLQFSGREKRPPRDPFNALLSLGAVILHSRVDLSLRALGLLPTCGFYHQPHGRHATLASDLMEPVRHRVERTALSLLRRGTLRADSFQREDNGACKLLPAAKRSYFEALEHEFAAPSRLLGASEAGTLVDHLRLQSFSLIAAIDQISAFHPIRYR